MSEWRFEWLTHWDEVWDPSFVRQWDTWMDQSPTAHVFFRPSLVRAWYETYRELWNIEPRFLIARQGNNLAFWPLVHRRGGWRCGFARELAPIGYCDFDSHDPLVIGDGRPSEIAAECHDATVSRWRDSSDIISTGRCFHLADSRATEATPVEGVPVLSLQNCDGISQLLAGKKHRNLRKTVNNYRNRLGKRADWRQDEARCGPLGFGHCPTKRGVHDQNRRIEHAD